MSRIPLRAAASIAVLLAAACGDAPTEPAAFIVAEHARAALEVSVPLPSLAGAEAMDEAAFRSVLGDLALWLDAAEVRLASEPSSLAGLPALRAEVAAGRAGLEDAARLEAAGQRGAAVAALIDARAHLMRTTGLAVAERRIAAAAAAEARCGRTDGSADAGAVIAIDRGRRLLTHARDAFADGDFERALQRAHYAEALLAGECAGREGTVEDGR